MCPPCRGCELMTTSDLVFAVRTSFLVSFSYKNRPFCHLWSLDYTRASLEHSFGWLDCVLRETIGCFFVVEFQGSVGLLNSPFKCNVIYTLRRLHLSKSEGTMYDSAVYIELCSSATKTDNDLWSNNKPSELYSLIGGHCATQS